LVEDQPLVRLDALDALEAGGYTIIEAASGDEALAAIGGASEAFAGILTDIRLGSGPVGWDVARYARERTPDIPVVYTSGDSAHEWPVKGVPNSVMVQKPYAAAQLVTAISTLLTSVDRTRTS
jgi:CheY-like chemotaxis protein